jgi:hypothetical protein
VFGDFWNAMKGLFATIFTFGLAASSLCQIRAASYFNSSVEGWVGDT